MAIYLGPEIKGWDGVAVRSPSMIYESGFTLAAYEGWNEQGPQGIGFALAVDQWLQSIESAITFTQPAQMRPVRLKNAGLAPMSVTGFSIDNSAFNIVGPPLPRILHPDETVEWSLIFNPETPGSTYGRLTVSHDAAYQHSLNIRLQGYFQP